MALYALILTLNAFSTTTLNGDFETHSMFVSYNEFVVCAHSTKNASLLKCYELHNSEKNNLYTHLTQ